MTVRTEMLASTGLANLNPESACAGPVRHHLDGRARSLIEQNVDHPDDLLTTRKLADWLGVSAQFLEIARSKNFGPTFIRLSPRLVRYRRADVLQWLEARAHASTAAYSSSSRKRKAVQP